MARLFVAVWPPEDVLGVLAAVPRLERAGVRWTTPDQWHVTLRFLGEADPQEAAEALDALSAETCTVELGPTPRRLGRSAFVLPARGLEPLAAAVDGAMVGIGRPSERRGFHGHLTLARLKGDAPCGLADLEVTARWPVASVVLVESTLGGTGARYQTLSEMGLRGAVRSDP